MGLVKAYSSSSHTQMTLQKSEYMKLFSSSTNHLLSLRF